MSSATFRSALNLSPAERTTRRRRKDARPSELTAAALELFVEQGFAATRLDHVAARAGVSKGTLYLYFDSKEALFKAVIKEGIVPTLAAAEQRLAEHQGRRPTCCRQAPARLVGSRSGGTRLAGVTKLIISESRNFPEVAQYYHERGDHRGRALLRTALQRGIENGEFRPLDVETAIDVIIAPLLMLAIWRFSLRLCGQEVAPEAYLEPISTCWSRVCGAPTRHDERAICAKPARRWPGAAARSPRSPPAARMRRRPSHCARC